MSGIHASLFAAAITYATAQAAAASHSPAPSSHRGCGGRARAIAIPRRG
ncbi:MAG TPA: hypothetical protein VH210_17305 [Gaiellaceae bacterium]|nr:hypothetical protein [Gaiellaceae bacterium]